MIWLGSGWALGSMYFFFNGATPDRIGPIVLIRFALSLSRLEYHGIVRAPSSAGLEAGRVGSTQGEEEEMEL